MDMRTCREAGEKDKEGDGNMHADTREAPGGDEGDFGDNGTNRRKHWDATDGRIVERSGCGSHRPLLRRKSSILAFASRIPPTVPFKTTHEPSPASALLSIPWLVGVTAAAVAGSANELRMQNEMTAAPLVFRQRSPFTDRLVEKLSFLSREMRPGLVLGTRGVFNSALGYLRIGPRSCPRRLQFREVMTMAQDGAKVAIDWELPDDNKRGSYHGTKDEEFMSSRDERRKEKVLRGPIANTVVLILHGINNDASFGYMRSAIRACTDRGWFAAGMNFRGCGGLDLATPRGYNGAYTGDLRCVVNHISSRIASSHGLFLVGNSLGANLLVKYLGEEGNSGTLPSCVLGGISLGNPLEIHSGRMSFPWSQVLALGLRQNFWKHRHSFKKMNCSNFQHAFHKALLCGHTVGEIDRIVSPFMIRNDPYYPFAVNVGYDHDYNRGGEEYWKDASSVRYIKNVSVPLLIVSAQDDFLIRHNAMAKVNDCISNPNVIVVKTKSGGHLGWIEAAEEAAGTDVGRILHSVLFGGSWADGATMEFIDAILSLGEEDDQKREKEKTSIESSDSSRLSRKENRDNYYWGAGMEDAPKLVAARLRSRL